MRAAIRRPVGARNIDAVKRRTRAGMGRCQGGFCSPRVMEILAEELGMSLLEITKFGGGQPCADRHDHRCRKGGCVRWTGLRRHAR